MQLNNDPARIVAVVTGAGTGLGRALAIELAKRGVSVVGFGRRMSELRNTQMAATGNLFQPMEVDVSDDAAVVDAFSEIDSTVGQVTVLINNAAIHPHSDFLEEPPAAFMKCVSINLGGAVSCSHAALTRMTQTGRGRIVNVGSFADLSPLPSCGAYSVSKGAMRILSRALVADLADRFPNIVISTWMPGILATEMGLPSGLNPADAARWGANLALSFDAAMNGAVFERDYEIVTSRSIKRRILDRMLFHSAPPPRRLGTIV